MEIELIKEIQLERVMRWMLDSGWRERSGGLWRLKVPDQRVRLMLAVFTTLAIKERVQGLSKHQRCIPNLFVSCSLETSDHQRLRKIHPFGLNVEQRIRVIKICKWVLSEVWKFVTHCLNVIAAASHYNDFWEPGDLLKRLIATKVASILVSTDVRNEIAFCWRGCYNHTLETFLAYHCSLRWVTLFRLKD